MRLLKRLYFRFCVRTLSEDAKCPACGNQRGKLAFCGKRRKVVHACYVCGAEWGEEPVLEASKWLRS